MPKPRQAGGTCCAHPTWHARDGHPPYITRSKVAAAGRRVRDADSAAWQGSSERRRAGGLGRGVDRDVTCTVMRVRVYISVLSRSPGLFHSTRSFDDRNTLYYVVMGEYVVKLTAREGCARVITSIQPCTLEAAGSLTPTKRRTLRPRRTALGGRITWRWLRPSRRVRRRQGMESCHPLK